MITPLMLHNGLCDFLEKEVASTFKLKSIDRAYNEHFTVPKVIRSGFVLPKSIDSGSQEIQVSSEEYGEKGDYSEAEYHTGEEFPYFAPRIDKVEHTSANEAIVTIEILYGVYGPATYSDDGKIVNDGSGYTDLWNMIETTRQKLFITGTIAERFSILADFYEAEMLEEQLYPYWEGFCKTKWHIVFPQHVPNFHPENNYDIN